MRTGSIQNSPTKFKYYLPHSKNNISWFKSRVRNHRAPHNLVIKENQVRAEHLTQKIIQIAQPYELADIIYSAVVSTNLEVILCKIYSRILDYGIHSNYCKLNNLVYFLAAYAHKLNRYWSPEQQKLILNSIIDHINDKLECQYSLILIITKSTKLGDSEFLQTMLKNAVMSMTNNKNDFAEYGSYYYMQPQTAQDQYLDLQEFIVAIFKAQQHPNLILANYYQQLFKFSLNRLSQYSRFTIIFHNLIKNQLKDKNQCHAMCNIIQTINNKLFQSLTSYQHTLTLRQLNFFNWIKDCQQIMDYTRDDKNYKIIYNFSHYMTEINFLHLISIGR